MTKFKYIEVCAGCGGLSYGLELAGLHPMLLVEIDKKCCETLKLNFPETEILCKDMRNVDFKKYNGKVDIVVGGIPCQSFSVAGKREGLNNENKGGLFYDFLRCLTEVNPHMFMIENVEGLKSVNGGETLKLIVAELEKLGFFVEYQILNASKYLVPQKRKRLIIIGTRYKNVFNYPKEQKTILTLEHALKNVPSSQGVSYSKSKYDVLSLVPEGGCWINLPKNIQITYMGNSLNSGGGKRGMARRLAWNEPCLTLTTSPCQKQTERCHPEETRPLTTREYARIQTFPDSFGFEGNVSSIYKQIGNAVPPMLAFFIGREIIRSLKSHYVKDYIHEYMFNNIIKKNENNSIWSIIDIQHNIRNFNSMEKTTSTNNLKKIITTFLEHELMPLKNNTIIPSTIDKIKEKIEMGILGMTKDEYKKYQKTILLNKQITQKIGYLHEHILQHIDGWTHCKNLNDSNVHADIMKKDKSIFIELKNSWNTMNCSSRKTVINNLIQIKNQYPNSRVVLGIINPKSGNGSVKLITGVNNKNNIEIYEYSGIPLINLITGNPKLFEDVENIIGEYFDDLNQDFADNFEKISISEQNEKKPNKKNIKY